MIASVPAGSAVVVATAWKPETGAVATSAAPLKNATDPVAGSDPAFGVTTAVSVTSPPWVVPVGEAPSTTDVATPGKSPASRNAWTTASRSAPWRTSLAQNALPDASGARSRRSV